jgi:hypothetical protein
VFLCECRSSTYSRYYDASALERVRLGPFMGGDERAVGHAKTLGSLPVAQALRISIDAVVGFHASVSNCDVQHRFAVFQCERTTIDILSRRGCVFFYGFPIARDGPSY